MIVSLRSLFTRRTLSISDSDRFIYAIAFLLIILMAARTPLDGDMWWHLRSGQETLLQKSPLLVDVFSFTRYGQNWINHSWLAQAGMAGLYNWLGFPGICVAVAFLAAGSLFFVLLQMEGPAILKAFLLILAGVVAAPVWSPRPQTISLLLMATTGYVLHLYKWQRVNHLWLLPLIMAVWSNMHGGYPLGFLLMGCVLAGEALNHLLVAEGNQVLGRRNWFLLLGWVLLSGLAVLLNPNGLNTWWIPFKTVNVGVLQNLIAEWASPDFHDVTQQPLLWLTFAILASVGLSGRRMDGVDILAVSGFGMMAFMARRHFGPFALAALPVLSRHLWPALQAWSSRVNISNRVRDAIRSRQAKEIINKSTIHRLLNLMIVGLFGILAAGKVVAVSHPAAMKGYLAEVYPVEAVAWLEQNPLQGNLLSEYNWGGYLIWTLPEKPVFVDGRTDLFGDEIIGQWMQMVQGNEGWQDDFDAWQIQAVLLHADRPLIRSLQEFGWEVQYQDEQAIILDH